MREVKLITVQEEILADNAERASQLRARLTAGRTFLMNVMSSPGAGKTSLITHTIAALRGELQIGVLEADIESIVDSEKIAALDIPVVQIRTGGACHLDTLMVEQGLSPLNIQDLDMVIMENVGNLVCPAEFDTGAHLNVMILSVPEGDDKPLKYPLMFTVSDALIINKMDYLPLSDFDLTAVQSRVEALHPGMPIFPLSCRTGEGVDAWVAWLRGKWQDFRGGKVGR